MQPAPPAAGGLVNYWLLRWLSVEGLDLHTRAAASPLSSRDVSWLGRAEEDREDSGSHSVLLP